MNKKEIEMAASIYAKFSGMGIGVAIGTDEEMEYFQKMVDKKMKEKKAEEERKRKAEMKKRIVEKYRELLDELDSEGLMELEKLEFKTLIANETDKWIDN